MIYLLLSWNEIGLMLGISKALLDAIDLDMPNTNRKVIEMLATWINNKNKCIWQDLIDALKKLVFIQENPNISPVLDCVYQHKEV